MGSKKKTTGMRFSPERKAAAVKLSKTKSHSVVSKQFGCSMESVANWIAQSEGHKDAPAKRAAGLGATKRGVNKKHVNGVAAVRTNSAGLPTTDATVRVIRASKKALVANSFQCPHCDGPIDLNAPVKAVAV